VPENFPSDCCGLSPSLVRVLKGRRHVRSPPFRRSGVSITCLSEMLRQFAAASRPFRFPRSFFFRLLQATAVHRYSVRIPMSFSRLRPSWAVLWPFRLPFFFLWVPAWSRSAIWSATSPGELTACVAYFWIPGRRISKDQQRALL